MKTKRFGPLLACISFAMLSSIAFAGPGLQQWQTLRSEAQFEALTVGDKVAFVCDQCKAISEIAIESKRQGAALHEEGASVTCPSCKAVSKVMLKQQRNDPGAKTVITYLDDKGAETAFIAKVIDSK